MQLSRAFQGLAWGIDLMLWDKALALFYFILFLFVNNSVIFFLLQFTEPGSLPHRALLRAFSASSKDPFTEGPIHGPFAVTPVSPLAPGSLLSVPYIRFSCTFCTRGTGPGLGRSF